MRRTVVALVVGIFVWLSGGDSCTAGVEFGLSISDGQKSFYLAIGERYEVPQEKVVVIREKKIPDEELPVLFFVAKRAGVAPEVVIKLRLGGKSWMDICLQYGVTAEAFYVPLEHKAGPPYGKAYGHFKNRKKAEWRAIRFTDVEIINFVNLRFISEHYGYSPDEVVKLRTGGAGFVDIHAKVKKNKGAAKKTARGLEAKKKKAADTTKKKGKGKGE